jgi:hypothetical protein
MIIIEIQHVVEIQIVTANVNVVDINVTTRSRVTEENVLKDKKPRKAKKDVD